MLRITNPLSSRSREYRTRTSTSTPLFSTAYMAEPKNRRLVTEKRGFRVKPIKHPRYSYVVYRIADGRRVEQAYFQSERRRIKLEPFVKEFLKAKEEGKTGKKR